KILLAIAAGAQALRKDRSDGHPRKQHGNGAVVKSVDQDDKTQPHSVIVDGVPSDESRERHPVDELAITAGMDGRQMVQEAGEIIQGRARSALSYVCNPVT